MPPHVLARSPGMRPSTCREWRHSGQWLRWCPPQGSGPMKALHWIQRKWVAVLWLFCACRAHEGSCWR